MIRSSFDIFFRLICIVSSLELFESCHITYTHTYYQIQEKKRKESQWWLLAFAVAWNKKNDYLWLENQSKYSLSRYYSVSREIHTDLVNVRWVIRYHCRIKEYVYIYIYIYTHTYMYVYCSSERELSVLSKKIGIIFFFFCASRLCC